MSRGSCGSCDLRFQLHYDAPAEFVEEWRVIVKALTDSDKTDTLRAELLDAISKRVHATGSLHKNDAKILDRHEGGFGGNMNDCDRQIRFLPFDRTGYQDPHVIRMCAMNGDVSPLPGDPYDEDPGNHKMEWTFPELIDFKHAVATTLRTCVCDRVEKRNDLSLMGCAWIAYSQIFDASIAFDHDYEDPAAEKEAFDFYVSNYPKKRRKKRATNTKTAREIMLEMKIQSR